ncbi:MAG TPA: GAF domain-containing sensor histidine kinase, partial [Candidatus Sulfotelmatobacter sp.]|nr:GAF domain-containing sensor histidine kinase [Candidatus Sulfotelmatobacter sp.]
SGVSLALTTTTAGVDALNRAVLRTVTEITGGRTRAALLSRNDRTLSLESVHPEGAPVPALTSSLGELLAGRVVRSRLPIENGGDGSALAVPMFYQREVVGALLILIPAGAPDVTEDAEKVLTILANNAAVAIENARLFEQEREMVRRLRELDAMKTDFLATVQHELRTPLTAILGLSDLAEMCWDMWDDTPKLDAIRDIQMAAKNLYDIVETIIDFAMLEDENLIVERGPVAVRPALEAALASVSERIRGGLPVPVEIDGGQGLEVYADAHRLQQAFRALLDNAVKFSDGRGAVRVIVETPSSSTVRITVADEGVGIPDAELERIFERFYQVDNTTTRRYGGTGMGLALVKRVVEAHGASIRVESAPGIGTRFIVDWPGVPPAFARPAA